MTPPGEPTGTPPDESQAAQRDQVELPPQRVAELFASGEAQVVDVRTEAEYELGHLGGARHMAFDELSAQADSLDRSRPLVLYCRSGGRSRAAADAFAAAGWEARSMAGGLIAWVEAGLALEPEGGRVGAPSGLPQA